MTRQRPCYPEGLAFRFASIAALALFTAVSPAWCADTVAVLPLFNINGSIAPDLNWIGESVAETIHETLSAVFSAEKTA